MHTTDLLVVGLLIGCGSGSGNRPSIGTSQDNFCDQIAAVACYDMYQCCAEGEIERFLGLDSPRTAEQCRQDMKRLCERRAASVEASFADRRARLDPAVLNACLDALTAPANACATTSSSGLPWTTPCGKLAFVGTAANGGACFHNYECALDSYCAPNDTCTPLPGDGAPCVGGRCASSAYCNFGTCHALAPAGGACQPQLQFPQQCMQGLYCDPSTAQCAALHKVGEKCTAFSSCQTGSCVPGVCPGFGNACFADTDCPGHCQNNPNFFCSFDGNCASGHCSINTAKFCSISSDCFAGEGSCVFPIPCIRGSCEGGGICADVQIVADYCSGALQALPVPPG